MHAISSTRTLLALPLLLLGAKTAGAMQEAHPILGDPLVINGETIPFEEIKRQVAGGTWSDAGGPGIVRFDEPSGYLLVRQSQPVQGEIEELVDKLRLPRDEK